MDTRSLKPHKRPKKNKSESKKGNANVLVVPPDILKKLGISIGNTSLPVDIHNNISQSTEIANNGLIVGTVTSNIDKQASESSILETANLMKKSVFLSPTFVPTVANVIPGEVEISNDTKVSDSVLKTNTLDTIEVNKIQSETINAPYLKNNKSNAYMKNCEINVTCDMTINGVFTAIPNTNNTNHDFVRPLEQSKTKISLEKELLEHKYENCKSINSNLISNGTHISNSGRYAEHLKPADDLIPLNKLTLLEDNEIDVKKLENNVSSLETGAILIEQTVADDNLNPMIISEFHQEQSPIESGFISLEGNTSQTEQDESNIREQTNVDYNINYKPNKVESNSLNICHIQMGQTEVVNNLNSLEKTEIHLEQSEAEYSLKHTGAENNHNYSRSEIIQPEIFSKTEPAVENHLHSLEGGIQIIDGEFNLISLEGNTIEMDKAEMDSIFIPLEVKSSEIDQTGNNSVEKDEAIHNIISIDKSETVTGLHYRFNSTEGSAIQIEPVESNISLEEPSIEQIVCEDDLRALLHRDRNLEFNKIAINAEEEENIMLNSFQVCNGDFSQIPENEIDVQDKVDAIELTEMNNSVSIDNCNKKETLLKVTYQKNVTINLRQTKNSDIAPVQKLTSKINIISEEVITPINLKDSSRSQSPIIRALTPVPLNTVIALKKINENLSSSEIPILSQNLETVLSRNEVSGLENCVVNNASLLGTSVTCQSYLTTSEDLKIPDPVKASCNVNNSPSEKTDTYKETLENGDLKNNNDICNTATDTVNRVNTSIRKVSNKDENNYKNINDIHKKPLNTHIVESVQCMDIANNSQDKDVKRDFDTKDICSEEIVSRDIFTQNKEKDVIEKDKTDYKKVEKNIKKKNNEVDKNKNQRMANDSEDKTFCDDQLNNILKSSKDNSTSISHVDKVKEIAEYIKKFAHIYKGNRKVLIKNNNVADSKKGIINSKSNSIKSKLCIQGVEKPGGKNPIKEVPGGIKAAKTYSRQNRRQKPCLLENISGKGENSACNLINTSNTDISIVDITTLDKKQDFCLCYDFGRLDIYNYDNSYEHIHFWLHNNSTDLETILSIYNDNEIVQIDRTESDDINISGIGMSSDEDEIETSDICWNYFVGDQKNNTEDKKSNKMQSNNDYVSGEPVKIVSTEDNFGRNNTSKIVNQDHDNDASVRKAVNTLEKSETKVASHIKPSTDVEALLKGDGKINYAIVTIVEDEQNNDNIIAEAPTVTAINNEKEIIEIRKKTDNDGQGERPSEIMKTPKEKEVPFVSNTEKMGNRKRSLPENQSLENSYVSTGEPTPKKNVKCGVCNKLLTEAKWEQHLTNKHSFIAWKAGHSFNFDDPELLIKVQQRLQSVGTLKCFVCNLQTKKFSKFMVHVKNCIKQKEPGSRRASSSKDIVTCAVCHQNIQYLSWIEHIGKEHNYLAWISGQKPLNVDDEAEVVKYLHNISKANSGLICSKCGLNRKRAKLFLTHIETCDGSETHLDESTISVDLNCTRQSEDSESVIVDKKAVTCGVCKQEVPVLQWTEHIGKEHNYLAWEEGSTPLNVDDEEAVWNHLQQFIRHNNGLFCYKCGLNRKRVKLYLSHIETCDGEGVYLDESVEDLSMDPESTDTKQFECGVCNVKVSVMDWNEHIGREHNYLAWKVGSTPLDVNDEDAVKEHLLDIIRNCEGLICYKCGLNRRRVKLYLSHVQNCDGTGESRLDDSISSVYLNSISSQKVEINIDGTEKIVKCGVCDADVALTMWIEHIAREHTYMAWMKGQEPLNLDDEEIVREHLLVISREENGLKCNKCGIIKKYPKSFIHHIKECSGNSNLDDSKIKHEPEINSFDTSDIQTDTVMCGVCSNEMNKSEWMDHMSVEHDYMTWLVGRPPLDLTDAAMVQKHLSDISRKNEGLKCKKCGLIRKYAKSYLQHIQSCGSDEISSRLYAAMTSKDLVECAVCSEKVDPTEWRNHAMKEHYNVAWIVGATPIEINNPYGVEPYIKEYQQKYNKLVCKTCGINRVSAVGFYAHIITCGKSEEETEIYKSVCEICNNKYLRIYKSQHMTMHREQEYAQERKVLIAKEKAIKKEENAGFSAEIVGGRRKAAEKAKTVIEKYTSTIGAGLHCSKCGFNTEIESEMSSHVCVETKYEDTSDSDESVELDHISEDDDEDTDIDSNISDEEREARDQEQTKSKKHGESATKIQRLPFQIKNVNSYMRKSAEEFAELHLTDMDLFPQWRNLEYEQVPEDQVTKYMPPIDESCKVRHFETDNWKTFKRFEATKQRDIVTLFTGACIQCIRWIPTYVRDNMNQELISMVTHLDSDVPRHFWYEKPEERPALVQIWDCGNLISDVPQFVMGLALDCGVIWAIDWCPSGARDVLDLEQKTNKTYRLGLIAVASANGSAYVFNVPHPATLKEKNQTFLKLKPVVEMRLAMSKNRDVYQATAIKWSSQKGHSHIVVGYSDGTTAYYDLRNESPLLQSTENNVTILYPYYDERAQSMCIEDVDVFASRCASVGAVVAGSVGGAGVSVGVSVSAGAALHAHAAAARVLFPPHWPAALLAGDDNLVSQAINELEWYGGGRRVGGTRACCGCAWCGRVGAASAPLVRVMRAHPAYAELHRQVIATIHMIPFGNKRKRKNDELSMIMEPLTYNDAVMKYGIEFKQITARDKHSQQRLSGMPREAYPERFPLSDITSMMFCPSLKNHHKLAVATHAGLLFIVNV